MKVNNKNIFALGALVVLLTSLAFYFFKRNDKTNITISDKIIDLGEIKIGVQKKAIFSIRNVGNNDLRLADVIPDCYCTVPNWEKQPISPQKSTNITIIVNKDFEGIFQQVVSFSCNSKESKHLLVVRGKFIK